MSAPVPKRVLLVEDDLLSAKIVSKLLEQNEYDVTHAADGAAGLSLARKESFDLILLDWLLPSLDGFKICKLLKMDSRFKSIPIIVVTGRSDPADLERIREAGVDGVVSKTKPPTEIVDAVRGAVGVSGS